MSLADGAEGDAAGPARHSSLVQRRRQRHIDALANFQQNVRTLSSKFDEQFSTQLLQLRAWLEESHGTSQQSIADEMQRHQVEKLKVQEWSEIFAARAVGDDVVPLVDEFHSHTDALATRTAKITERKNAVLGLMRSVVDQHNHRMAEIISTVEALRTLEAARKEVVEKAMVALLDQLANIAYCNVTKSQVVVQRAAVSIDQQIIANTVATENMLSQLQQLQLYKLRQYLETVGGLYNDTLSVMALSVTTWSQQSLASQAFRFPDHRLMLLRKCTHAHQTLRDELGHAMRGLTSLVEALGIKRDGASIIDIPGGTTSIGWLRGFQEDRHAPVLSLKPSKVTDDWRIAVELFLTHTTTAHAVLTSEVNELETALELRTNELVTALDTDLVTIFTLSEDQVAVVRSCALNPDDVYPLDVVLDNEAKLTTAQQNATAAADTLKTEIAVEKKWFLDTLQEQMRAQFDRLVALFTASQSSVIPQFVGAARCITEVVEPPCRMVRQFVVRQQEIEKDYHDTLALAEEEFTGHETRVLRSGNTDEVTKAYAAALDALQSIENLYITTHDTRLNCMEPYQNELESAVVALMHALWDALNVKSLQAAEEHNNEVAMKETKEKDTKGKPAKGDKKGDAGDAPPPKERIPIEQMSRFLSKKGHEYLCLGHVQLGQRDTSVPAFVEPLRPTSAPEDEKAPEAAAAAKEKPKKDDKKAKGKKGQKEEVEVAPVEPTEPKVTPLDVFQKRITPIVQQVFAPEVIITDKAVVDLVELLRVSLVDWVDDLKDVCLESAVDYCDTVRNDVESYTSDVLRKHQRRPATLQASVYERRLRELEDATGSRVKFFTWVQNRVVAAENVAKTQLADMEQNAAADLATFVERRTKALPQIVTIPSLDAHARTHGELQRTTTSTIHSRAEAVKSHLLVVTNAVSVEVAAYLSDRAKDADLGGTLSEEEVRLAKQAAEDVKTLCAETVQRVEALATAASEKECKAINDECALYQTAMALNIAELRFFQTLQDGFSSVKGKVSNLIAQSATSGENLEKIVTETEGLLQKGGGKPDTAFMTSLLSVDYEVADTIPDVPVDNAWQEDESALGLSLRKTRLLVESESRSGTAMQILLALEDLRKQAYARGLYLGCLQHSTENQYIPQDAFLDSKGRDLTTGNGETTVVTPPQGAKKPKAGKAAPVKQPVEGTEPEAEDPATVWARYMKVTKGDVQLARVLAAAKDGLQAKIQSYYQGGVKVIRPALLGVDQAATVQIVQQRLQEQEQRFNAHVVESTKAYRLLIQRVHLLLHRVSQEVYGSLLVTSAKALEHRCSDTMAVFQAYYCSLVKAKKKNNTVVKGSMAAPSNRHALEALMERESYRQGKALHLLQRYSGFMLREAQDEAFRFASRCSNVLNTLFTMFKSVVTPEHLVPGDEIQVGEHKNLKKLLRLRAKEEQAKVQLGGEAPQKAPVKGDKKGAEGGGKKKDGEKGGKGKGKDLGTKEDEEAQLPPLEKPTTEYPGIQLNAVRALDAWKRNNPEVLLKTFTATQPNMAPTDGLQTADGKEKPKPGGKAPAKGGAAAGAGASAEGDVQQPILSPPLTAVKDRLHAAAGLHRSQTVTALNSMLAEFCAAIEKKFNTLNQMEVAWVASWGKAISQLKTENLKPAPAASTTGSAANSKTPTSAAKK